MRSRHARTRGVLLLVLVGTVVCASGTSWAQGASPTDAELSSPSSGSTVLAGTGAVLGSIFFVPFKALIMCPVGAVAAGGTYAVTGGETETANYLLRLGCTGTYFISPAMIQGQEAFRRYDER